MEKEKLWVISELFYPEKNATGYLLTQICEGLTEQFEVNVIAGPPSYTNEEVKFVKNEVYNRIKISRLTNINLGKNNLIARLLRLSILSMKFAFAAIKRIPKNSKLLIVTNPVPLLILISIISKIKGIKLYILVHDVYPENMVSAGLIKKGGVIYLFLQWLFKKTFARAHKIIVLGRDMKDVFEKKNLSEIHIVENWAENKIIFPKPKNENEILHEKNLQDKLVFLFAGNIGRVQGIKFLIKGIKKIDNDNIHFLFAGGGAMESYITNQIEKEQLKNITMLGPYNRSDQVNILNACDIGIVSLSKGMYGLGVPSKTYNLLAAGKPILYIGDKGSEIDLLVKESKIGWSVPSNNFEELVKMITHIYDSKNTIHKKGKTSRFLAETKFTKNEVFSRFNQILSS